MKADQGSSGETQPPGINSVNDKLPRWGQCVGVVTPYFQCRGFLEPSGEWRDAGDGSVIENVRSWFLIDAGESNIFGEQSRLHRPGSPLPT